MHTESKRCIYHYPGEIVASGIGSALRPHKRLEAFIQRGDEVDVVSGTSAERKRIMKQIREKICSGAKYDFLYAEDRNIPYALSDDDHLPRHPFADISFIGYCRRKGIPIGLFYRDVYWKFPLYKKALPFVKRTLSIMAYQWEAKRLEHAINILYLPSNLMKQYIFGRIESHELPPGCTIVHQEGNRTVTADPLEIFYVGSISSDLYNIKTFCEAVKATEGVNLTICTPQTQWNEMQEYYQTALCDRITIVHKRGKELESYYMNADIFSCCIENNEYRQFAMPLKVFESIGYGKPILATMDNAVAALVDREGCGWTVEYSKEKICAFLEWIKTHPEEIRIKTQKVRNIAQNHTWQCRAQQVADELTNWKKG